MIHRKLYIALLLTLLVGACDKPEAKPSTNIEKDGKAETDTVPKGKSADDEASKPGNDSGKSGGSSAGKTNTDSGKSGGDGDEASPAPYSFAFGMASVKAGYTAGTYTRVVVEKNKPEDDTRDIMYTSGDERIATVDNVGKVTFKTVGTVTITATKAAKDDHAPATDSYELSITKYRFAFDEASHEIAFTAGTYTRAVVEKNKPEDDTRDIMYTSGDERIATVDNAGKVTFKTVGTVTITATKAAKDDHAPATDSYELSITRIKPLFKLRLVGDIKRAMDKHGNTVNLNYIDTSAITDMSYLFSSHSKGYRRQAFNGDISGWDVSNVTDMNSMFKGARSFNGDISKWNVSNVTDMSYMFKDATSFNGNISKWKVGKVIRMRYMFAGATSFSGDISKWKVGKVNNMERMFENATAFNQDISGWDVSNVAIMIHMFENAALFSQNLDAWEDKINAAVKANEWNNAFRMFFNSGLTSKLPSWCENVPDCKTAQS